MQKNEHEETKRKVYDFDNLPEPYTFEPLNIDPELEKLFPIPTDEEFKKLKESILKKGFDKAIPIVTWNGFIVDGHNRYKICRMGKVPYVTVALDCETKDEVFDWMYRTQMGRRNLNSAQKIEISLKMEHIYARMAKKNQGTRNDLKSNFVPKLAQSCKENKIPSDENKTNTKLAKQVGIGKETFRKGAKIFKSNNEALKQKIKTGQMSINAAYNVLIKKPEKAPVEKPVKAKKDDGISDELRKICEDIKTPKSKEYIDSIWDYKINIIHYMNLSFEKFLDTFNAYLGHMNGRVTKDQLIECLLNVDKIIQILKDARDEAEKNTILKNE